MKLYLQQIVHYSNKQIILQIHVIHVGQSVFV